MRHLSFVWHGHGRLRDQLIKPLRQVALEATPNRPPHGITLYHKDGTALSVYSKMYNISEGREIGILHFDSESLPTRNNAEFIDISFDPKSLFKLCAQDKYFVGESGFILESMNGDQIIVVANALPCTLALGGIICRAESFDPEYSIEEYSKILF